MQTTPPSPLKQELERLLQQEISPEQFYRQYLGLLMKALQGMVGCHLWLAQGGQFSPLGGSDRGPILFDSDSQQQEFVLEKIALCAKQQKTIFVSSGNGTGNKCPFGLAFTPLLFGQGGGAIQGAQVTWWQTSGNQMLSEQLHALLDDCGRSAARMARNQKLESMAKISESLQLMERYLGEIATAPDLPSLAVTAVNRFRELVGCDRCAFIAIKSPGELSVEAISNVPALAPRSAVARTILQLAQNAMETGLPTGFRKSSEKLEEAGDLSDYFYHNRMEEVLVVGIQPHEQELLGMVVMESEKIDFFTGNRPQIAASLASNTCGSLRRTIDYDLLPMRSFSEKVVRWRKRSSQERTRLLRKYLWIPAAVLAAFLLFPVKYQFSGDAHLLPSRRALAVAQIPGRIVELLVEDGAFVQAGQPLARLDDSELLKQREIARQEESRFAAESDRLSSNNDRVGAKLASLALKKSKSEREFYDDQLTRAIIKSPIRGLVISPSLASRQGDALPIGGQLAMVGDPSSWELEVSIPESDIADVIAKLQKGEAIPVRYLLNSLPQKNFSAQITSLSSIAAASEVVGGKNIFRISVQVGAQEDSALLRTGYTGRARLEIGRRPLAYTSTRRFINWLRTNVFF